MSLAVMRSETKDRGRRLLFPLIRFFTKIGIPPIAVTLTALPLSIGAAVLFSQGFFFWAGIVLFFIGLCDTIDGELSRQTGTTSPFGAFLDSTVDRVSEGIVLIGLGWHYLSINRIAVLIVFFTLLFSFLVSYVRARAEGIGQTCVVGFFERPVRVALMFFSAVVLGERFLPFGLAVIALGSFITFLQRVLFIRRENR